VNIRYVLWVLLALLASALLVFFGVFSFKEKTARIKPVVPPYDIFWCSTDEQCSVVDRIGCCPCSQGGAQAAVTKWHRDELRVFLKSACKPPPVCVQLDLCRPDARARCVKHRCTVVYEGKKKEGRP